jgi:hypothetical protein
VDFAIGVDRREVPCRFVELAPLSKGLPFGDLDVWMALSIREGTCFIRTESHDDGSPTK